MELEREHPGVKQSMLKALGERRAAAPPRHAPQPAGRSARDGPSRGDRASSPEEVRLTAGRHVTTETSSPATSTIDRRALRIVRGVRLRPDHRRRTDDEGRSSSAVVVGVGHGRATGRSDAIGAGLLVLGRRRAGRRSRRRGIHRPKRFANCASFEDDAQHMNRSVMDVGGSVLVVRSSRSPPIAGRRVALVRRRAAAADCQAAVRGRRA